VDDVKDLHRKLDLLIIFLQEKIMAAIDDLNKAVTDLTASMTAGMAQIDSELQTILGQGNLDPQIETAVTNIEAEVTALNADIAAAQAALQGGKKV